MTNKRREKPQPPVLKPEDRRQLALMEEFREDIRKLETDRTNDDHLQAFKLNPLQFRYAHYDHLFKLWMMARERGDIL